MQGEEGVYLTLLRTRTHISAEINTHLTNETNDTHLFWKLLHTPFEI